MGQVWVSNKDLDWKKGIPWVSTGKGWKRAQALWRHNGTKWVQVWKRISDPPPAPKMSVERITEGLISPTLQLRGPYEANIIRAVVEVGIGKAPTAAAPKASDKEYYSMRTASGLKWSEWWEHQDVLMAAGKSNTRTGAKTFPQPGMKRIPDGTTVYVRGWIQDEYKQWSPSGYATVNIPKKKTPPKPAPKPKPKPPAKKTYTDTWSSSWSRSYTENRAPYSWANTRGYAMQGQYLAANGRTRSLIGFPNVLSQIGDIVSIQVYVYMRHWYYSNGGTLTLGLHPHTKAPSRWTTTVNAVVSTKYSSRGQGKWITIPKGQHKRFLNGTFRGISLHSSSRSTSYYGYADPGKCKLRIKHKK